MGSVMGEVLCALQGRKRHCQKAKGESFWDVRTLHVLLLPHMHTHAHNTNALHIPTTRAKGGEEGRQDNITSQTWTVTVLQCHITLGEKGIFIPLVELKNVN